MADYCKILNDAETQIGFDSEWDGECGVVVCAEDERRMDLPSGSRGGRYKSKPKEKKSRRKNRLIGVVILDEELEMSLEGHPGSEERIKAWGEYYAQFDTRGNLIRK